MINLSKDVKNQTQPVIKRQPVQEVDSKCVFVAEHTTDDMGFGQKSVVSDMELED